MAYMALFAGFLLAVCTLTKSTAYLLQQAPPPPFREPTCSSRRSLHPATRLPSAPFVLSASLFFSLRVCRTTAGRCPCATPSPVEALVPAGADAHAQTRA